MAHYDEQVIIDAVTQSYYALGNLDEALRNNNYIVLTAVKNHGKALEFASNILKDNERIVFEAVKNDGCALEYASERLKDNKDISLVAVKNYGNALTFVSRRLRNDIEIVSEAVNNNGLALLYASAALQSNRNIVRLATNNNWLAINFMSYNLLNDKDIFIASVKQSPSDGQTIFNSFPIEVQKKYMSLLVLVIKNHGATILQSVLNHNNNIHNRDMEEHFHNIYDHIKLIVGKHDSFLLLIYGISITSKDDKQCALQILKKNGKYHLINILKLIADFSGILYGEEFSKYRDVSKYDECDFSIF
jgi:hypothetical protein